MTPTSTSLRFALLLTCANGFIDPHTYLARGGVFANVQTGNVIFAALNIAHRNWAAALSHLWPILAFLAGVLLSSHIKSKRIDRFLPHPLRWMMGLQAVVFAVIGFVPASVPHSYVTVPISFVAALQIGLFRNVGDLAYMPVATTGNLMRLVESGYDAFVEKNSESGKAFAIYAALIGTFASGAVIGAVTTTVWGVHAIWLPAGLLAVTLALFVIDEREGKEP